MPTATLSTRTKRPLKPKPKLVRAVANTPANLGELLDRLGGIPPERVRFSPPLGTATLRDLIEYNDGDHRDAICELVEGTLVEKPVGISEAFAATWLSAKFTNWNEELDLGKVIGADGIVRLLPALARGPDSAFYRWDQFPERKWPPGAVPLMFPDLAVEILSKSNTKKEMTRKRHEYFTAGTRIVWEVDLKKETVVVYHDPVHGTLLGIDDTLSGEDVMPGFTLSIRQWFERVKREG